MTAPADDLEAFTGDPDDAALLRRSLGQVAELAAGTPLAARVADVLAGRVGMRELAADPDLVAFAQRGMVQFDELWSGLDPRERADALRAAQAWEAEQRT